MRFTGWKTGFLSCLSIVTFCTLTHAGREGWAYYEFLEDPVNSRSVAMGTAGTALPENRGISFYNPALPSLASRSYLSFDYGRQYDDLGRAQLEFALVAQSWFFNIGFQSQSTGEFQVTDETGIIDGATQTEQSTIGVLGGGFKKSNYAAGISLSAIQSKIADSTSYGLLGSAGITVNLLEDKLYAGAAVFNVGRNSSYLDYDDISNDNLPLTVRGGVSWNDTLKVKYPYTVALDVVYSKNYQTVMVPVGVEFWLFPALAIRAGKRINFESDLFSLGVGLRLENLTFDAAFTPVKVVSDVGMKWSTGLTYRLASPKKKAAKKAAAPVIDTTKTAITDTAKTVRQEATKDSVPAFKTAVERKIIRKAAGVESEGVLVDSSVIVKPVSADSAAAPVKDTAARTAPADMLTKPIPADTSVKTVPLLPVSPAPATLSPDSLSVIKSDSVSAVKPAAGQMVVPATAVADSSVRAKAVSSGSAEPAAKDAIKAAPLQPVPSAPVAPSPDSLSVGKSDSAPAFKPAVERKIVRKAAVVESDGALIDSSVSVTPVQTDSAVVAPEKK